MTMGKCAYPQDGNHFLAPPPLAAQAFAVVGIPFDGAVTNWPGARFGPSGIRRATLMTRYQCVGDHSLTLPLLRVFGRIARQGG